MKLKNCIILKWIMRFVMWMKSIQLKEWPELQMREKLSKLGKINLWVHFYNYYLMKLVRPVWLKWKYTISLMRLTCLWQWKGLLVLEFILRRKCRGKRRKLKKWRYQNLMRRKKKKRNHKYRRKSKIIERN